MPVGRKKVSVSSLFEDIDTNSKCPRVKCRFCGHDIAKNGSRMKSHIETCINCPKTVQEKYKSPSATTSIQSEQKCDMEESDTDWLLDFSSNETRPKKLKKATPRSKTTMEKFTDTLSASEQEKLDSLFSRAVYASATPFSIVENPHWIKFFKAIRPAYVLPSRFRLSNPLLDLEYNKVDADVMEKIADADCVGIMCDGWSNTRNEAIINFIVSMPQPVFWKSFHSELESHTGEYICGEVRKVVEEIKAQCGKVVIGLVTDNASNMKRAWNLLQDEYPEITCYGCAAHSLNLIFGDLTKLETLAQIVKNAKSIVKEFKSKHMLVDLLSKVQKEENVHISLKLPVKSRWGSTLICMDSVQKNKHVLRKLVVSEMSESTNLSRSIKRVILDDNFWETNEAMVQLLNPLFIAITSLEADEPNLADVYKIYNGVETKMKEGLSSSPFATSEQLQVMDILAKRKDFCIHIVHKSAYLLDPRYHGMLLSDNDRVSAVEFICKLAETFAFCDLSIDDDKIQENLALYTAREGFYSKSFLWKNVEKISPTAWWKGFCSTQELSKIACKLLNLPSTTASVERSFSTYANIHTAKRNKLSNDKAKKLVFISQNIKYATKAELPNPAPSTNQAHASTSIAFDSTTYPEEVIEVGSSSDSQ